MRSLFLAAALLGAGILAGCQSNVSVTAPSISPTDLATQNKTAGKYAVYIQTGGWQKDVDTDAFTCSAWTFPTDFENGYVTSAQGAFRESFQEVKFVPGTLKPADLKAQGFDGQIIVYQGGMDAKFGITPGFWTNTPNAQVAFHGIVAVVGPGGLSGQSNVKGEGAGQTTGSCFDIDDAIAAAGTNAMKSFIVNAVNTSKLNVLEMRAKTAEQAKSPTS